MSRLVQAMLHPRTASQLFSVVAPKVVRASRSCSLSLVGSATTVAPVNYTQLNKLGKVYLQSYDVISPSPSGSGETHRAIIAWAGLPVPGLDQKDEKFSPSPSGDSPVWVSCDCGYFRFKCEWALTRYASSDIIYSNGEPARITNPRGIPYICKHLYAVIGNSLNESTSVPAAPEYTEEELVSSPEDTGTTVDPSTLEESGAEVQVPDMALEPPGSVSIPDQFDGAAGEGNLEEEEEEIPGEEDKVMEKNSSASSSLYVSRYVRCAEGLRALAFDCDRC